MDYQVIWSRDARENYRAIATYLLDVHSFNVADRFTDTVAANAPHPRVSHQIPDPAADTKALEAKIDQLVYALNGFTAEEVSWWRGMNIG